MSYEMFDGTRRYGYTGDHKTGSGLTVKLPVGLTLGQSIFEDFFWFWDFFFENDYNSTTGSTSLARPQQFMQR
jgi:hypothetical protein